MIQVIHARPPNFDQIVAALPGVKDHKNVLFTYGEVVYDPDAAGLTPWLREHEATHVAQQRAFGADDWWTRYLAEPKFRLGQEVEAMVAEYKEFCRASPAPNRTRRAEFIDVLAYRLSSHVYGYMIRKKDAKRLLQSRV